ncbi:MAG: hypothetical protein OHK0038_12430 [Flammeovirgaceae bacterium]
MKSFTQNTALLRNVATMFILITFFGNWSKSNDNKKKDKKDEKKTEAIIKAGSEKRG